MSKRDLVRGGICTLAVLGLVIFSAGCEQKRTAVTANHTTDGQPGAKSQYVGSEACRECHEGVYRGWQTTFHAKKFQPTNPDFIIGDFVRNNTFAAGGKDTVMSREGGEFFITTTGPENKVDKYKVKFVIGSIWKQFYITEFSNGALQVLPVQWNVLSEEWSDYFGLESHKPGDGSYWSDKELMFQYQCMGCHTMGSKVSHDEATDTYTTSWEEMGVSCESCHGPGRAHVEADLPDKFDKILNPPRVPDPRRAAMVCGSCHDVGTSQDGKYAYPVDYLPGDELRFHLDQAPSQYPDGSPRTHHQQYNDWRSSGHARAGVMCWDCHSPHVRGKFNRFQLKLPGSLLCNTCHTTVSLKGAHSIHSTNNCIGCHMPNTVKSATPGDLRSHRMTVVRPEWTVEAGGDVEKQPNSCNLCHYHKDYDPERLVHFLYAVVKPEVCALCHKDEAPEDYDPRQ